MTTMMMRMMTKRWQWWWLTECMGQWNPVMVLSGSAPWSSATRRPTWWWQWLHRLMMTIMIMMIMMAVTMTTIMPAKLFYHYYNLHVTLFPCWLQTKTTCGILDQWQYIFAHGDTVRAEWSLKTSTFPSYWYYLTFVLLFAPKIHILPLSYLSPSGYPLHSDSAHPLYVPEWMTPLINWSDMETGK